jgi:hypothetical protein
MISSRAVWILCLMGAALGTGCANQALSPSDAAISPTDATGGTIGPVDLSQAPTELTIDCDHGVGQLALVNPCLVGESLTGAPASIGTHETECRLAGGSEPIAWAFLLPLAAIALHPDQALTFPTGLPSAAPWGPVDVGGQKASVSGVAGTLTFSRVDPTARAFVGQFKGVITWTGSNGTFSCSVAGPFWGAPGNFI